MYPDSVPSGSEPHRFHKRSFHLESYDSVALEAVTDREFVAASSFTA